MRLRLNATVNFLDVRLSNVSVIMVMHKLCVRINESFKLSIPTEDLKLILLAVLDLAVLYTTCNSHTPLSLSYVENCFDIHEFGIWSFAFD